MLDLRKLFWFCLAESQPVSEFVEETHYHEQITCMPCQAARMDLGGVRA